MKKAIITGASGGIGDAVAKQLDKQNCQFTLVARNEEKLERVLLGLDSIAQILGADLSDHDGLG